MGLLGGSSTKQWVKMSVCFDSFHLSRIGTISYPSVLYQFRCLALGHNTVTLTSVTLELTNLQLSHCAPHRHEMLRQTLSIITLILLDSLLLIFTKRDMQTTTIYMFGFSKETSHLDGSFEYPEEIQMIFFSKFANLPRLMINPIIRI